MPVPADSSLASKVVGKISAGRSKSTGALTELIPEGIVQTSRRERAVGFRFRTRLIRNLLIDEAGRRRCDLLIALAGGRIIRIFGFHWGDSSIYDLALLNTSELRGRVQ